MNSTASTASTSNAAGTASTADPTGHVDTSDTGRAALQKRTLRVLMVSQTLGSAGNSVAVTVGGRAAKSMLGADTFAGSASAAVTFGGAVAGMALSAIMARKGRRPGLLRGYLIAFGGAIATVVALENRAFVPFLVALLFFGVGQGTNLLSRYAAADLATVENRGRAISLLLFGSTFGAVGAQVLVGPCERAAKYFGLWGFSGPFVFAAVMLAFGASNIALRLRPDPLVVAGGVNPDAPGGLRIPPVRPALRIIRRSPMAMVGLISMIIAQASMVAVMTMTPIHMADHGHSGTLAGLVIACHVIGMFGFAPLVGRYVDRSGRLAAIVTGAGLLVGATVVSALAGYRPSLLFLGLFLLGLGWSFAMIGGSTLVTESVASADRVTVQGAADLTMSVCGGSAAFASGFIKRAFGFHMLANVGTVATLALLVIGMKALRRHPVAAAVA